MSLVYKNYAKCALLTSKQLYMKLILNMLYFIMPLFGLAALIALIREGGIGKFFLILLSGAAAGIVLGVFTVWSVNFRIRTFARLERTEGYTPRLFTELERLLAENKFEKEAAAVVYSDSGYADRTLEILGSIDPNKYTEKPNGAHLYYVGMIKACLLKGDIPKAVQLQSEGCYYLKTYMNSPIYGATTSIALGMYEYFLGHYDISLGLLDNAMRIDIAGRKPKNRLPDENSAFIISYWRAMCFASSGNKAAAWDIINSCKDLYTTDYYRQCAEKLLADIEKNEKGTLIYEEIS